MAKRRAELVILMGLQGAGKSSFYRHHLAQTHRLVSKDLMKNRRQKDLYQEKLIREFLGEGDSVVVDNMNLGRFERLHLIKLGHKFNAKVVLYYFPLTVTEGLKRNLGLGRKQVPPVAIYSSAKKLEKPGLWEGYDELYLVRLITFGFFEITPIKEDSAFFSQTLSFQE